MFCSNCGKIIDDNAKFCNFCGLPVKAAISQPIFEPARDTETVVSVPIEEPISENMAEAEYASEPITLPEPQSNAVGSAPTEDNTAPTPENIQNTGATPNTVNPVSVTFRPNQPPMYQQQAPQPIPKAPKKLLPERKYTLGHIIMCLSAVAVMAIVAGIFAGLYFSVV